METLIFVTLVSVYVLAIYTRKPKTNRQIEWLKKPITAEGRLILN